MYFIILNYHYSIWNRNDENKIACSIAAICTRTKGECRKEAQTYRPCFVNSATVMGT